MVGHVDDVPIRVTCLLSVLGSIYLLFRVWSQKSNTVLAKQLMHLAAVDLAAFGWNMLSPSKPCDLREKVFKFLLAVSIATELTIAIGLLMVVMRCHWLLRHGGKATLLVWPVVGFAYIWYFTSGPDAGDPSGYDHVQHFCVGTEFQVDMELVYGWAVLFVVGFLYLILVCIGERRSPGSVASSHLRYGKTFLLGYLLACVPYGIYLVHVREYLHERASLDRTYYLVGHISICSSGFLNALIYKVHRLRNHGDNLASFHVAFEQNASVVTIDGMSLQALQTAEAEAKEIRAQRRREKALVVLPGSKRPREDETTVSSEDPGVSAGPAQHASQERSGRGEDKQASYSSLKDVQFASPGTNGSEGNAASSSSFQVDDGGLGKGKLSAI